MQLTKDNFDIAFWVYYTGDNETINDHLDEYFTYGFFQINHIYNDKENNITESETATRIKLEQCKQGRFKNNNKLEALGILDF